MRWIEKWINAIYLMIVLTRRFHTDWELKLHFFKIRVWDIETNNDYFNSWSATFQFHISFPRPEIILESKESYILTGQLQKKYKKKMSDLIRCWWMR